MGIYNNTLEELRTESIGDYKNFPRMSEENVNDILRELFILFAECVP